MTMKVSWSQLALADMRRISVYLSADKRAAAKRLIQGFKKTSDHLALHPYRGRRSEAGDVRELVLHPNYLLSYRVSSQSVEILQVWHVAQTRYH